jgi:hypothetical protein
MHGGNLFQIGRFNDVILAVVRLATGGEGHDSAECKGSCEPTEQFYFHRYHYSFVISSCAKVVNILEPSKKYCKKTVLYHCRTDFYL